MSKNGTSELCKILANIDSYSLDFCVANSPPIYPYNMRARRSDFEELYSSRNPFSNSPLFQSSQSQNQNLNQSNTTTTITTTTNNNNSQIAYQQQRQKYLQTIEKLKNIPDSEYEKEMKNVTKENITPEKTYKLLQLYEWELKIRENVEELNKILSNSLLYKDYKTIPPWIISCLEGNPPTTDINLDCAGNWGVVANLSVCPKCGMPLSLGDGMGSVAVFPCSHSFHLSCLHSRHCPACYASCFN